MRLSKTKMKWYYNERLFIIEFQNCYSKVSLGNIGNIIVQMQTLVHGHMQREYDDNIYSNRKVYHDVSDGPILHDTFLLMYCLLEMTNPS